ncbi:TB182 protein, partial [Trogon melanurus]|nr:TB182 protein [Trogon melanurus]
PSLTDTARPKPPIRPKPCVLPKPAMLTKAPPPHTPPAPRPLRSELPSAEKMNRLAGPQPYSGGSSGGPLRRPSFTLKSSETPNGKGLPSAPATAAEDLHSAPTKEVPPAPPTPSRKGPAPFRVTPVPVATKPERFPGTTVEEILAKMDSREGPGSPDRARPSPFCPDPSSRFGSKAFSAFRRHPSGEADPAPPGEACQASHPTAAELGTGDDGRPIAKTSTLGPPGSPRPPAGPALAPGAPFQPSAPTPGSPNAPLELLAPGSPILAPGFPQSSPPKPPTEVVATSTPAPGAPSSTAQPQIGGSRPPGSPHTPGEGSPDTASPAGTPKLPPRITCPPGSPEAAAEYPASLSHPPQSPAKASCPPGSPEGPDDSPVSPQTPKAPDFSPPSPSRDPGVRRSSEGVLCSPVAGQGLGELGGSLSALPCPKDPLPEPSLGGESGWSLSQSFEWTFPSRGPQQLASLPRSPITEAADSGLSEESESEEDAAPHSPGDSGSEGAPCPGGPVARRGAKAPAQEEKEVEGKAEQDAAVPHSPLCVTEPGHDLAESEPPTQPGPLLPAIPPDLAPVGAAALVWPPGGDGPGSLQGPREPGQAEGFSSSHDPHDAHTDPHADPRWLTELLASPGARHSSVKAEGPEVRERTELMGEARLDCSDWSKPHSVGESCLQDRGFGAPKPTWSTGYGDAEAIGTSKADWSSSYGVGQGQQHDEDSSWAGRFGSGHRESRDQEIAPAWAGEYGGRGVEVRDRELPVDWASKYGSRDAETKEKDFTLGWAGRSGTGDTGTLEKELGPSRAPWDSQLSTRDMESQDREFSPSRPARASEYSARDRESQDREFSPSRPAETSEHSTGHVETQEWEFSPGRLAWASEYSSREMETQESGFEPSRAAWDEGYSTRDTESQDQEFSHHRPAWGDEHSVGDTESRDWEFSPRRVAEAGECNTGDMETHNGGFSPGQLASDDELSPGDMETQESGFSPSQPAWDEGYSTRDMESQGQEFSPSRAAWPRGHSSASQREETEFSPGRLSWAGECSAGHTEMGYAFGLRKADLPGSCAPEPPAQEPGWGSTEQLPRGAAESRDWAEELGVAERHNQFGVIGTERAPDPTRALLGGSVPWAGETRPGGLQEPLGDWHRDLSFGSLGAASCPGTSDASGDGPCQPQEARAEEPGWHAEPRDAEAKRREWAKAFDARCAARSQEFSAGEQSLEDDARKQSPGGDTSSADGIRVSGEGSESPGGLGKAPAWPTYVGHGALLPRGLWGDLPVPSHIPPPWAPWSPGVPPSWCDIPGDGEGPGHVGHALALREQLLSLSVPQFPLEAAEGELWCLISPSRSVRLLDPSPPMANAPADPPAVDPPQSEPPSPIEEERAPPEPAATPTSPRPSTLLDLLDTQSAEARLDHPDGRRPLSWQEKRLSLGAPQPEGPLDLIGQEFTFLEDTEVLDSSVYRSKASLGRKRRHRAPALRPGASADGDGWIFRDSTEPRPDPPATSSDEEVVEEPKSRRVRASLGKGVKVPLFPGLNTSALKAKLRGRNRSAEEAAAPGDSKATPPKDPHVQRSKSCKIPGLSGKPPTLPPKPEKSSG